MSTPTPHEKNDVRHEREHIATYVAVALTMGSFVVGVGLILNPIDSTKLLPFASEIVTASFFSGLGFLFGSIAKSRV